ncbi:phage tail protein [Desulfovibrio oxyclinae]|uniref:phage tail protein n=1 Tax=Desulfovibrio oxyclinae TaxID=63560 RepID=UPI0012EAB92B|nr:phage tail protein [Desulfovibrio oxyclinae]
MSKQQRVRITGADELLRAVQGFEHGGPQVAARALNKTARGAGAHTRKLLRQLLKLPDKEISGKITIWKANPKSLYAAVIAREKRGVPLIKYPVRPRTPNPKRPPSRGVSVQVKRFGGQKTIPGAFVARMKSGHVGVFKRTGQWSEKQKGYYVGEYREDIRQLYGPSFVQYLNRGRLRRKLDKYIQRRLETTLRHEINWQIQKQFNQIKGAR